MKYFLQSLILVGFLSVTVLLHATSINDSTIELKIPQPVIADLVQKSLPMQLDTSDYQMIGGIITIQRITDIQLKDGALFAKAWIDGSNVSINTEIAGHQLRLNVGNARLSFNLRSEIRYVQGSRLLYIRPEITEMHTSGNQSADQLQGLLASLLSSREYPLSLENLSPLTVNTINKQLLIHMNVEHVLVKPGKLVLRLSPHISEQ